MRKGLLICFIQALFYVVAGGQTLIPQSDATGKWGFADEDGNIIIPCEYDEVSPFVDGSAAVEKKDHCGLIDMNGKPIGRGLIYGGIDLIGTHSVYRVELRGKVGLIDTQGQEVLPANCDAIELGHYVIHGHHLHTSSATIGIIDYDGKELMPEGIMRQAYPLSDKMVVGKGESKANKQLVWKLYDTVAGKEIELPSPPGIQYHPFHSGYALVNENSKTNYFIDRQGKKCSPDYEFVGELQEGHYVVRKQGLYGVIDSLLKERIPCQYEDGGKTVSEGLWNTMQDEEWGYVDLQGKNVIPFSYEITQPFFKGYAYVGEIAAEGFLFGLINHQGKLLVPIKWADILYDPIRSGELVSVWVASNSLYSRLDLKTQQMSHQPGYSSVLFDADGNSIVCSNNMWGCVDAKGTLLIPTKVDSNEAVINMMERAKRSGITDFSPIVFHRLMIYENPKRNAYTLSDKIPDNMWDY